MRSPRPRDTPLQVQRPTPTPGRGSRTRRRVGLIVRPRQANRAGSPAPSRWAPLNRTCSKGPGVGARAPCSGWSRAWSRRSRHGAGGLWGLHSHGPGGRALSLELESLEEGVCPPELLVTCESSKSWQELVSRIWNFSLKACFSGASESAPLIFQAKGHCHPRASSAKTRGFHTQLDEGPETP